MSESAHSESTSAPRLAARLLDDQCQRWRQGDAVPVEAYLRTHPQTAFYLRQLAQGLSVVATRLEPAEAPRVCSEAAAILTRAMTSAATNPEHARALLAVAAHLEPAEAARVWSEAATILTQVARAIDPSALDWAQGLSVVLARLEPAEAARLCFEAAATLIRAMAFRAMASRHTIPPARQPQIPALSAVLARLGPRELSLWLSAVAIPRGTLLGPGHPAVTVALLAPALEPLPCRLSTQELVELLKQPTCFGQARRVILDHLENRYRRKFIDHWAFVRFAQEQQLDLDLTSPPRRFDLPSSARPRR